MELQGRNIRSGMQGSDVALLQTELQQLGYHLPQGELDGARFGEGTRQLVLDFQLNHDLEPTGVVDQQTADFVNIAVERLTEDDIYDEARYRDIIGPEDFFSVVSFVLTKAPADVVKDLVAECVMLMPQAKARGEYIPASVLEGRHVLLFPEDLLQLEWSETEDTTLHEIAHFVLDHTHPLLDEHLDYDAQEPEPHALVEQWLSEAQEEETK